MTKTITQTTLRRYLALQRKLKEARDDLLEALKSGRAVEQGGLTATVVVQERRTVKWRAECEKRLGADAVKRIVARTPVTVVEQLRVKSNNGNGGR